MGICWSWIVEDSEKEGSWKRKWLNRYPWIESVLSWMLCLSCLSVSGYNYYLNSSTSKNVSNNNDDNYDDSKVPLLLMTHSYDEYYQYSFYEHCQQFSNSIQHLKNNDEDWIHHLCTNLTSRRLASILMKQYYNSKTTKTEVWKDHHPHEKKIIDTLKRIWNSLLRMPSSIVEKEETTTATTSMITISLILPLYKESVSNVQHTIQKALAQRSSSPSSFIEIILVHAISTDNNNDEEEENDLKKTFQQQQRKNNYIIKYVEYKNGGGRGPTLNYGAKIASGSIYTFCHADTILPKDWDYHIQTALLHTTTTTTTAKNYNQTKQTLANACSFSFGIAKPTTTIPGIAAVECTANIRTQLFSLPYGDQTISLRSNFFHFIGGFPNQCLFEDYELISLLRQRQFYFQNNHKEEEKEKKEELVILPQKIYCSPRRWQKYGVLYVTFMNSKFVNYYVHSNMSPNDLYCLYYQTSHPPKQI